MAYHIVLNRPVDLGAVSQSARAGLNPRHSMAELQRELDATVHDGSNVTPDWLDKAIGKLTRMSPLWWAIARKLRREIRPGDAIFCTGEDIGLPVAALCGGAPDVHVTVMTHYVDRKKKRLALRLLGSRKRVAVFFAVSKPQASFLSEYLHLGENRVRFIWDQTDTHFFTPGSFSADKARPVVMSVGLEKRDYSTLAAATADLDIDVRISGYSADTRVLSQAFPETLPHNMTRRFYSWPDLLQLYRDADVVVVSLFPNTYAAGVQGLMEALSCGRPVIVTTTDGLAGYIADGGPMRLIAPGDPAAMRNAIEEMLMKPADALLSSQAADLARTRHSCEQYVSTIASTLRSLAKDIGSDRPRPQVSGKDVPTQDARV